MPPKGYRATHCKQGHRFTEANTIWMDRGNRPNPQRLCRQCLIDSTRKRRGSKATGPSQKLQTEKRLREQQRTGKKQCSRCKRRKPFSDFKAAKKTYDGLYGWCRACCSQRHRELDTPAKRAAAAARIRDLNHGLAEGDYDRMLADQGGGCAICGRDQCTSGNALAVDHCHTTGKIRGILCAPCNQALGLMADSPERLRSAVTYLERA